VTSSAAPSSTAATANRTARPSNGGTVADPELVEDHPVGPCRLGGQWLGAPVAGLDDLAAVVFEVTGELVPVTHPQPFQADVVLARGRVPKELAGRPVSASWTARSVSLVADRSSPRGPRYEDLAAIPLGA